MEKAEENANATALLYCLLHACAEGRVISSPLVQNQFGQRGFPMCKIPYVSAVIPYKFGTAATGFDGSAININVISSRAICIVEVCRKKRNANQIKPSIWIIYCFRNLIHVGCIAVINEFESDRPGITLLRDGSLNRFNLIIFWLKISNKEGMFIANDACGRVVNNERYPVSIKGYWGIPSSRRRRCCQSDARRDRCGTYSKEGA